MAGTNPALARHFRTNPAQPEPPESCKTRKNPGALAGATEVKQLKKTARFQASKYRKAIPAATLNSSFVGEVSHA